MTMSINMSHMEGSVSPIVGCSRFNAGRYGVKSRSSPPQLHLYMKMTLAHINLLKKDLDVRAFTFKISYSSTAEVI